MNYTATCELADTSEVKRSLKVLVPENDIVEIRALEACERNSGWPANFSGYFDNPDAAAAAVTNFSQFFGAYWTLNQLQPELIAKSCNRMKRQRGTGKATSDSHVIGLRWVLIDCDAQRLSGISSTNEELAASRDFSAKVRKALSDRGFPEPVTANSGNGFHLLYRVNLPVGDVELVERFLKGLAAEFDTTAVHVDTGVFKLSQLCKLYGTMACKGDHTDDRPHRMSRIIAAPADSFADMPIVSRELLESQAVAKEPETEPDLTASASHRMNGETTGEEWLADWLARHGLPVTNPASNRGGVRYQIKENPLCEHEAPDAIVGVTSKGAIYAKCSHNSCSWNWHDLRAAVEGVSGRGNERPSTSQAGDQSTEKRAAPKIHYKWMTSAELDAAEYKIEYLVERTLVAGQPCVLVGPKKCLKTSLLVDLGIAIATGGMFLGYLPASRPARVAMMSGESGMPTLQETARRIAGVAGRQLSEIENLAWSDELPKFASILHLDAVERFLEETQAQVLIIDPAYLCMPSADAGNLMAQGEILRGVAESCQKHDATLLLAHHSKKTNDKPHEPPELEHMAWAGFQEFVRQWILIARRERYEPGTGMHRIWLTTGGSMGHSGLWGVDINEGEYDPGIERQWDVAVLPATEAREDATSRNESQRAEAQRQQRKADRDLILAAMNHYPDGETKTGLRDASGLHSSRFNLAFGELIREGEVEACRVSKGNNRTYDGFQRVYQSG